MIRKDKNLVIFTIEDENKEYVLDINECVFLGLRKKPIVTIPKKVKDMAREEARSQQASFLNEYIYLIFKTAYGEFNRNYLQIADRISSLVTHEHRLIRGSTLNEVNEALVEISKEFKILSKDINEGRRIDNIVSYANNLKRRAELELLTKNQINGEQLTNSEANYVLKFIKNNQIERAKLFVYYLERGLREFFENDAYPLHKRIVKYCDWCDTLGWKYEKGNFIKEYAKAKVNYEVFKNQAINEKLQQTQGKKASMLEFENEQYKVVVPLEAKAFKEEAESQGNCVYSCYLEAVANGNTNVVFIRDKDRLNSSLVTCEVRNGRIAQYLKRYNHRVTEQSLLDFKNEYQAHLQKNWK